MKYPMLEDVRAKLLSNPAPAVEAMTGTVNPIRFDRKTAYSYYRKLYPMPETSYRKLFEHFWSEYLKHRSVRRLDWDMRVQKNPGEDWHRDRIYNAQSLIRSVEMSDRDKAYFLGSIASDRRAAQESKFRGLPNPLPEAKEALARYKADLKAGHKGAAEYWRGQAGAYFTANPKKTLTSEQRKALKEYQFAVSQEDRYLGSVFVTSTGQRKVEERTRLAYEKCKRLGMTVEHGLNPVYYHPAPFNTPTVYKEQFRNEWWVYSKGKKRWVTRKQAVDMLEKGAKFVMVRACPWEASLVPTKHVLDNPPKTADSTPMACQECEHRFLKKIGKSTIEVKCPKCGGYDVDLDYKARNPIGAIGTALVTGLGFGTGITMVDRMLKKGK